MECSVTLLYRLVSSELSKNITVTRLRDQDAIWRYGISDRMNKPKGLGHLQWQNWKNSRESEPVLI